MTEEQKPDRENVIETHDVLELVTLFNARMGDIKTDTDTMAKALVLKLADVFALLVGSGVATRDFLLRVAATNIETQLDLVLAAKKAAEEGVTFTIDVSKLGDGCKPN